MKWYLKDISYKMGIRAWVGIDSRKAKKDGVNVAQINEVVQFSLPYSDIHRLDAQPLPQTLLLQHLTHRPYFSQAQFDTTNLATVSTGCQNAALKLNPLLPVADKCSTSSLPKPTRKHSTGRNGRSLSLLEADVCCEGNPDKQQKSLEGSGTASGDEHVESRANLLAQH